MKRPLPDSKSNGRITCASSGKKPGMPTSLAFRPKVLDRLERKYQPMVEAIERDQGTMAADVMRTRLGQMKSVSLTAQSVRNRGSE